MIAFLLYFIISFLLGFIIIVIQSVLSFYLFPLFIFILKEKQGVFKYGFILMLVISIILDTMYLNKIGTHGLLLLFTYFLISTINFFALLSNPVMKLISVFVLYVSYSLFYFLLNNSFDIGLLNTKMLINIVIQSVIFVFIYYLITYFIDSNNKNDQRIKV